MTAPTHAWPALRRALTAAVIAVGVVTAAIECRGEAGLAALDPPVTTVTTDWL